MSDSEKIFIKFKKKTDGLSLPEKFTFPYYYDPHPLAVLAAEQLMEFLEKDAEKSSWEFGFKEGESNQSRGRMFGVLVAKSKDGDLGFLAAFSGNTSIKDKGFPFVPPIFDFWGQNGFYLKGIEEFDRLTEQILDLENDENFSELKQIYIQEEQKAAHEISELQALIKTSKKTRDELRVNAASEMSPEEFESLNQRLVNESTDLNYTFKRLKKNWKERLERLKAEIKTLENNIESKKQERKSLSNRLQEKIYKGFKFLNQFGETKGLDEIFTDTALKYPPSGAGECAAPRLLQYAFKMDFIPITMAEFWWGANSKDELRVHKHYYPACRGKCQPILGHMLEGIELEDNPLLKKNRLHDPEIIFEDDYLLVISKPAGMLSVPGKDLRDSVFERMQMKYPDATGPLIVHRLDMDTSGLMIIAKKKEVYKELQAQFIKRKVKKRYTALLDGVLESNSGKIDLPIMSDYLNRPRQIVSFEEGKKSLTFWEKIAVLNGKTLVHFYPHTGRTHQLRVHAAHEMGLNIPIFGDDIYGKNNSRLYLHAAEIEFKHPVSNEILTFCKEADFQYFY